MSVPEPHYSATSEEVQEILSHNPSWLIRHGLGLIFLLVCGVMVSSFLIRYPVFVAATATITSTNPAITVVAPTSGKLIQLAKEKSAVKESQYLAYLENPASIQDVIRLNQFLQPIHHAILADSIPKSLSNALQLGTLQAPFSAFALAYEEYRQLLETNLFFEKENAQTEQSRLFDRMNEELSGQREILQQEMDLAAKKFLDRQELYLNGIITKQELEMAEQEYLLKQQALKSNEIGRLTSKLQRQSVKKTGLDNEHNYWENKRLLLAKLTENLKLLQSAIKEWEHQFVLKAPCTGEVSFVKPFETNQHVSAGEPVLTVEPRISKLMALAQLPMANAGKVKAGMAVKIKLENYPANEFGVVIGQVKSISATSRDNNYLVEISLPQQLTTTYAIKLAHQQNMIGKAEIITANLRLFDRIFNQFSSGGSK